MKTNSTMNTPNILKVAFHTESPISHYDTADIQTAAQANILRALYSPLLGRDSDGNIIPAIAESYEWITPQKIQFKIRDGLTTIDGKLITAEDAYKSFKRLLIRESNSHGQLSSFLCGKYDVKADNCSGLNFKNNVLEITIEDKIKAPFFLSLITSVDFSIIPKDSIDWQSKELKIIDYRNTSGPFYLLKDSQQGEFIFKANPANFLLNENTPSEIHFIHTEKSNSIEMIKNGQIDLITTFDPADVNLVHELAKQSGYNVHQTTPLDLNFLRFTPTKFKELSREKRLQIAHYIKSKMLKHPFFSKNMSATEEFFASYGEGGLSEDKKIIISNMWENEKKGDHPTLRKIKISVWKEQIHIYQEIFKDSKMVEFIPYTIDPEFKTGEQEDAYILPADTGFYENISLLSYYLTSSNITAMNREEGIKWIENYMKVEDKEARLKRLKDLHFEILYNAYVVPISVSGYIAVARKPWKPLFYKYFAGSPLWMIEKEN